MGDLWAVYLIFVFFAVSQSTIISQKYIAKRELDDKKSNNELLKEYNSHSLTACAAMCQMKCVFFGFNPYIKKCRTHNSVFTSEMSTEGGWRYYSHDFIPLNPVDCTDLRDNGHTNSGVFEIYPFRTITSPVRVYCDMETMDGGWTAIQKRVDGSVSFYRTWTEYKKGFGSPEQDYWIGNDVIHQLTKESKLFLYVSITLPNGTTLYEMYDGFSVSNETENYKLFLAGPATGTLGDSMFDTGSPVHHDLSGMSFSTPDRDNDPWGGNCAASDGGGWWYNKCYTAFLNGRWYSEDWINPWYPAVRSGTSVRETLMLIKRH